MEETMFKTILVHLMGTERDDDVLAAASLAAQGFAAHLDCLYVQPDPAAFVAAEATAFGTSAAIVESIRAAREAGEEAARRAVRHFEGFLRSQDIPVLETPEPVHHVTASFTQAMGDPVTLLAQASRSHDLTVVAGESIGAHLLMLDVGSVLVESGRPLLLAPAQYRPRAFRTIAIAWKNKPEAARRLCRDAASRAGR
jgi:hypothetical protein